MSKKNSNVNLENSLLDSKSLQNVYYNFRDKLNKFKKNSYIIAVSGGPDSLALVALSKLYSLKEKTNFFYVLINHNIRKNSLKEAKKVKSILKKKKIKLSIINNKKKIVSNIQNNARKIRYNLLINYAVKKKTNTIITAHNLEDQVETFFIRLSRGSGLKGLSSMKLITKIEKNIILFRPLLNTKKKMLKKISKDIFGEYIQDPSNKNPQFLRTKIRNLKNPLKKSGIEYDQILKSIDNLASSEIVLEKYFNELYRSIVKKYKNQIFISLKLYKKLDTEIQIRLINRSIKDLKNNYYNPRSLKVINLIKKLKRPIFKRTTLAGCIFYREKDQISLKIEKK